MNVIGLLSKWAKTFTTEYKLAYQTTATGEQSKRKGLPAVTAAHKQAILQDIATTPGAMEFASTGDLQFVLDKQSNGYKIATLSIALDTAKESWQRHSLQVATRAQGLAEQAGTEWPPKQSFKDFLAFAVSVPAPTVLEQELKTLKEAAEASGEKNLEVSQLKTYIACAKGLILAAISGTLNVSEGWESLTDSKFQEA